MTDAQLEHYASWASIISLAISAISLYLVSRIKATIIRFRRTQRIRQVLRGVENIPDDALPLNSASKSKIEALKRNVDNPLWRRLTRRGKAAVAVHRACSGEDIVAIKEAMQDWVSYSEDL